MSKTTFTLKRKLFGGGFAGSTFGRVLGVNNWSNLGHMATGNVNQAVNLATRKTVNINPATNQAVGSVAGNIAKGVGKPLALAGALAVGTGLAAKGVVNKASEQSDGSKMFSQVKKNDMATTYTLKRKTFAKMSNRSLEDLHKIVASAPEGNLVRDAAQQELSRRTAVTPFTPPPTNNQPPKASQTNIGTSQTNMGATTTPKTKTSPGFGKRIINRWNNMSTLGKVGVGATAAVGVGLATNAILNNKKKKEQQQ